MTDDACRLGLFFRRDSNELLKIIRLAFLRRFVGLVLHPVHCARRISCVSKYMTRTAYVRHLKPLLVFVLKIRHKVRLLRGFHYSPLE